MQPTTAPQKRYWPFDEVSLSRGGPSAPGHLKFSAPWIEARFEVAPNDAARADALAERFAKGTVSAADLADVSWLFSSLTDFPLAYILPRADSSDAADRHALVDRSLVDLSPRNLMHALSAGSPRPEAWRKVAARADAADWKWDLAAALEFSATRDGHDPETLFTLARRLHLLESCEKNRTDELLERVTTLAPGSDESRLAAALIVRQNHHVTQKCRPALAPALEIAASARPAVEAFIRAEAGHDVLLARALSALETPADDVAILDATWVLMELFEAIARRNFLAFAMVVDIFERSSHRAQDPLATLLTRAGFGRSARMIDTHREINDAGGHENVGIGFLGSMRKVDAEYAAEALRLAERVTDVLHLISVDLIETLRLSCDVTA